MTNLQIAEHSAPSRGLVVEIHHPIHGLIGTIYPSDRGIRIVSPYLNPRRDIVAIDPVSPPALEVFIV